MGVTGLGTDEDLGNTQLGFALGLILFLGWLVPVFQDYITLPSSAVKLSKFILPALLYPR
jgi:hypothetical protein